MSQPVTPLGNFEWPVADLRKVAEGLRSTTLCAKCNTVYQQWLTSQISSKEDSQLDSAFVCTAEQLYRFVYTPHVLDPESCCDRDQPTLDTFLKEYLLRNPQSLVVPLFESVEALPELQRTAETELARKKRREAEKQKALCRFLAYLYFSSTLLAQDLLPPKPDEGDLLRIHSCKLFERVKKIAIDPNRPSIVQLQKTALLCFHCTLGLFERTKAHLEKEFRSKVITGGAVATSVVTSAVAAATAGPAAGVATGFPSFATAQQLMEKIPENFSQGHFTQMQFIPLSPQYPDLTYGFNPFPSGPVGYCTDFIAPSPSQTYGQLRLFISSHKTIPAHYHHYSFNLNDQDPLASYVVQNLCLNLKTELKTGALTLSAFRMIMHVLRTTLLPRGDKLTRPLISLKTSVYLTALFLEHLHCLIAGGASPIALDPERRAARFLVEDHIADNVPGFSVTQKTLEKIVNAF